MNDRKKIQKNQSVGSEEKVKELRNEDPLTGETGSHPVGSGVGAAVGGAAAGAIAGTATGPIGTVVGAVVGGVAGGLAGKAIAENIDPTVEMTYWRNEYRKRPYFDERYEFEDYEPAYRAGWESYETKTTQDDVNDSWAEREAIARQRWENEGGSGRMDWPQARQAAQDSYERVHASRTRKPR